MILMLVVCFPMTNVSSASLETYEQELETLRKQEAENAKKLTGVEKELAEYNYEIVDLDIKMNEANKKLVSSAAKSQETNDILKQHEASLKDTSVLYESAQKEYYERLRLVYENGIPTITDMLINSKGLSDFIRKINVYTSILEYYKTMSSSIKNKKEYIEYIKKDVEAKKIQIEQYKTEIEKFSNQLNEQMDLKKKKVEELEQSQGTIQANIDALTKKKEAAFQKVEDEIDRIVKEAMGSSSGNTGGTVGGSNTEFTGGQFQWPVDGYTTITTRFGTIYNLVNPAGSAHTGADIAGGGILGKPIRAIEAGTVKTATYGQYGYGNYVIIDHGKCTADNNNYISLYGHATTLAVSKGEQVEKGQVIAYVGSTGNSTGPHLHLELRINGKITDPLVQYPGMKFNYPYG